MVSLFLLRFVCIFLFFQISSDFLARVSKLNYIEFQYVYFIWQHPKYMVWNFKIQKDLTFVSTVIIFFCIVCKVICGFITQSKYIADVRGLAPTARNLILRILAILQSSFKFREYDRLGEGAPSPLWTLKFNILMNLDTF